ncbi:hypothetical protein AAFN88_12830 [Pelagibius sp. CAU 1746]|uniref:hypothetical protein n=1 Tax=Pelagibius sp. CAU 1746 TaxID=3140370 RepID=UPI00325BB252
MPRIPSAAEVSPIGGSASRLPRVRADAADFGLTVAQGFASFGGGIGDVGDRISKDVRRAAAEEERKKKNEQLRQLMEALDKSEAARPGADEAQHRVELREAAIEMVDNWEFDGSSPLEAAAKATRDLEFVEDERLKQLPAERRAGLKAATLPIRRSQALRVAQRAQNQSVVALSRQTEQTLQLLQKQAVREPAAAAHYLAEGRARLLSLQNAGALTPEQFAAQEETFRRNLYTAVVRGQPGVQALADLEGGVYDEALNDPELKRFLTQETAWRVQSETAQGAAAAEAQLARVRRGDGRPGELSTTSGAVMAAGDMADAELQAEVALRVRSELQSLRYAPEAEVEARIGALAPVAEAADAAARQWVQQEVWTQSRMMLRERSKDPAAYVMEQPAVAEAFAAAEKDPALLPDAVAVRLAAQSAMGLAPETQNVLTLEERARIVGGLRHLEPQQQVAALLELGRLYGDQAAMVASDLAEAGLSIEMHLAADPSAGPEVSGRLAQAGESQGEAKTPEGGAVEAATEGVIGEGQRGAMRTEAENAAGVVTGVPPVPLRKPDQVGPRDGLRPSGKRATFEGGVGDDIASKRSIEEKLPEPGASGLHPREKALLRAYRPLMEMDEDIAFEGIAPSVVYKIREPVENAAIRAGVGPEIANLAVRLTARNLKEGMNFDEALSGALVAAEITGLSEIARGSLERAERLREKLPSNEAKPRALSKEELLIKYPSLRVSRHTERMLENNIVDSPSYRYVMSLKEQAKQAGLSEEMGNLFVELALLKRDRNYNPHQGHLLAADEVGVEPLVASGNYSLDTSRHWFKEESSYFLEAQAHARRTGLRIEIENEKQAKTMLLALRDLSGTRHAVARYGATEMERIVDSVVESASEAGVNISKEDVANVTFDMVEHPYKYPHELTNEELFAGSLYLVRLLRASSRKTLWNGIVGSAASALPAKTVAALIGLATGVLGLSSDLESSRQIEYLEGMMEELLSRGAFSIDSQMIERMKLE